MILHVDMDAFYASVEERECPSLVGKPVIVGGNAQSRGVVAAANYAAREFGVHSAMPSAVAHRLCPQAVVIKPRIELYADVSQQMRGILRRFTPIIEPLALDEAFLDVTASETLFGSAAHIAQTIKSAIANELSLVASVGVASNKFIAKLASDVDKPDGLVVVEPGEEQAFLDPLPVGCIWGIGRVAGEVFSQLGISTIGELRALPMESLQSRFGRHGEHLWRLAHAIDDRSVVTDSQAKSISHETTFVQDIDDCQVLRTWLLDLTEQVAMRLRRHQLRARTVQVKLRFCDFHTITRSFSFAEPTNLTRDLWRAAAALLDKGVRTSTRPVRLLGFGASVMDDTAVIQEDLFEIEARGRQENIDSVVDTVNQRFGHRTLHRGGGPK